MPRAASIRVSARTSSLSRSSIGATATARLWRRCRPGPAPSLAPTGRSKPSARRSRSAGFRAATSRSRPISSPIPAPASPIRLSFQRLKAKVAGKCGLWPHDLGVSNMSADLNNGPYWNQGCALQSNVATQVADPVDLVRGRQEGRIDTLRRSKDIENLRQGKDPSTQYRSDEKGKINTQVGN